MAQVKEVACELPSELGVPISRFSRAELHRLVMERGVTEASQATIARWVAEDALKPSLQAIVDRLDAFEHHYNQIATPLDRTFTRQDLEALIARVAQHVPRLRLAA